MLLALKKLCVRFASGAVTAVLHVLPDRVRAIVSDRAPMVRPMDYAHARILLHVDSEIEYVVRLRSARKEPETVRWIESFRAGDVFYDIGANVGAYTLIAAKRFGGHVRVYAFEPSALNFGQLVKNLSLNQCGDMVMPLPVALGSATQMEVFNYQNAVRGGALHSVGAAMDERGRAFSPVMRQRLLVHSLDDAVRLYGLEPASHIKMDVDGGEYGILAGAAETLAAPSLRSVLVEANVANGDADRLVELMARAGFTLESSHHQARDYANLVFVRSPAPAGAGAGSVHRE